MLNELDKELVRRGHPFVRYADDAMIFCKSERAAERVKASITKYIEGQLFLKVNKEKTVVSYMKVGDKHLRLAFTSYSILEPLVGFEPTTPRLQITCSGQLS